ncbi:rplT, partial [Symbiodinium sp. KB8]
PVFNYNESLLKSPPQPRKADYSKDRRKALWLKYSLDTKMYGRKRNCSTLNSEPEALRQQRTLNPKAGKKPGSILRLIAVDVTRRASLPLVFILRAMKRPPPPSQEVKCKLQIACQTGDLRTVQEMIESGSIDVNEPEIDGDQGAGATAVIEAAYGQHLEVVKYLISRRADLTIGTRDENATVYDYARDDVLAFLRDAEALARCRAEGDTWLADKEALRKAEERKAAKPYIDEATEELRAELTAAYARIRQLEEELARKDAPTTTCHRIAKQAVMYALKMRYRSRRVFKRTRRELWIKRVSNNSKLHGVRYNVFICRLKEKNININRKILSQLGVYDRAVFTNVLETAIPEWKQLKEEADNRGKKKEYTIKELDDIAIPPLLLNTFANPPKLQKVQPPALRGNMGPVPETSAARPEPLSFAGSARVAAWEVSPGFGDEGPESSGSPDPTKRLEKNWSEAHEKRSALSTFQCSATLCCRGIKRPREPNRRKATVVSDTGAFGTRAIGVHRSNHDTEAMHT